MKIFESPQKDLEKNLSHDILLKLDIIQKEQRHARYDLQLGLKQLDTIKKGIAILVSTPEPDLESEVGFTEDNTGRD